MKTSVISKNGQIPPTRLTRNMSHFIKMRGHTCIISIICGFRVSTSCGR